MDAGAEPARRRRRGCFWALLVTAVLVAVLGVLAFIALDTPDLGAAPAGVDDGDTQAQIVARMATSLSAQLLLQPHGVITLSEHDLTVLVTENNPNPARFQDPQARIRDGLVVIDARTKVGPFTVDAVARLALSRTLGADSLPQVTATFEAVQVGGLGLPDFAARALQNRVQQAFDLQDVLSRDAYLRAVRSALDCVRVAADGVRLGFHRPGSGGPPADCG
jgi:hypothetical protein